MVLKPLSAKSPKSTRRSKKQGSRRRDTLSRCSLPPTTRVFSSRRWCRIAEKPESKDLSDGVKIGDLPAGKAIKFLHRGAYDDIDSTYDLITAFLDEKGLELQNRFVEEYLTDTTEPDDANLEADIYVFIK